MSADDVEGLAAAVLDSASSLADRHAPGVQHDQCLVEQEPSSALLAASENASLVIVGGRDRSQHETGWLGPVPLRLAARAGCPVVVVPSDPRLTGPVVVGVDGSATSEDALAFAFEQASRSHVSLRALLAFSLQKASSGLDAGIFADRRENARRQLSEGMAGWCEKFPDVLVEQGVSDEPPLRALRTAAGAASLVVVGSHGRGVVLRHVLGSVSSALLRTADCPVGIVGPAAGHRS